MEQKNESIPIIKCNERPDLPRALQFYCKYCKQNHLHGIGNGHRAAHCNNFNSPYIESGYYLLLGDC